MASAAPFPTLLVPHARVTVQMIAPSAEYRKGYAVVTGGARRANIACHGGNSHVMGRGACKEVHRMSENTWQQWWEEAVCLFHLALLPHPRVDCIPSHWQSENLDDR